MRGVTFASGVVRDLRHAVRRLAAAPAYTLFSIATLALAIGITTAVYSVVHHFLRVDYGIDDHRSVYGLYETRSPYAAIAAISWADYDDVTAQQESFESLAAFGTVSTSLSASDTSGSAAVLVYGEVVSGNYFSVARRTAAYGRTLAPADDAPSSPPVVVLAAATARRMFGDAPAAVGRTVVLTGQPFTVVGVIGDGFKGASSAGTLQVNVWVPLSAAPMIRGALGPAPIDLPSRDRRFLRVFGRLRDGVTVERASDEMRLIGQRLDVANPRPSSATADAALRSWSAGRAFRDRTGPDQSLGRILVGLPLLVFLIACTNLANLSLSRGIARRNALAVRSALGATRARLVREETSESVLIAMAGGSAGLLLAAWMLHGIVGFVQTRTSIGAAAFFPEVSITPAIAMMALATTLLAVAVGGVLPALSLTRRSLRESMASGNDTALPRWRGRSNLIALQVGVSVGLFLIAFSASRALPSRLLQPGPQLDGLAVAAVPFDQQGYDASRGRQIAEQILAELRRAPGVSMAGAVIGLEGHDRALLSGYRRTAVTLPGEPLSSTDEGTLVATVIGTPEMFDLLNVTAMSGRVFTNDDRAGGEAAIVINEALARDLFGAAMVAGQTLQVMTDVPTARGVDPVVMRIVGVVSARGVDRQGAPRREVYLPLSQHDSPALMFLAKGLASVPVEPLRQAIRSADPLLAPAFIGDGAVLGDIERVILRAATTIGHGLAAFALLLALAGLYGVLSHVVSLRSRELAVRVALGATARRIAGMVLRDGLRPVIEGLLIALGAAMLIRKVLSVTVADGLSSIDPLAFAVAAVLLLAGGLAACLLPARRAARIDPNVVLKEG